jgi:hypothetical protein
MLVHDHLQSELRHDNDDDNCIENNIDDVLKGSVDLRSVFNRGLQKTEFFVYGIDTPHKIQD